MKWIAIGAILLVPTILLGGFVGREVTSQQSRPEFAGVPNEILEENGIFLTLPVQPEGMISESEARARLDKEYPHSKVKEVVLADHRNDNVFPNYHGPVWVVSRDTTGETTITSGGDDENSVMARVEWNLVFFNARTGEYLYDVELTNSSPE